MARDTTLDITFDLGRVTDFKSVPTMEIVVAGHSLGNDTFGNVYAEFVVSGTGLAGKIGQPDQDINIYAEVSGVGIPNENRTNWVAWSQIGSASFLVTRTNDAGYRPMLWRGHVYQILQLGSTAIVYGSNGITQMKPVSSPMPTFGFTDIIYSGILCRSAVAGNKQLHYFISNDYILWQLSLEGLKKLGYKSFLSKMTNPILLYDEHRSRLYISDSTYGFVYNDNALGGWYSDVTGILEVSDSLYVASPTTVIADAVSLITNVFDFKFRGRKSIEGIELGIENETGTTISAAIDYRYDKSQEFKTTGWRTVSPEGYVRVNVSAVDLRIRIKNSVQSTFQLHYMNFHIKYDDRRYRRGARQTAGELS